MSLQLPGKEVELRRATFDEEDLHGAVDGRRRSASEAQNAHSQVEIFREIVEVKVVPDLVQYATIKAALEDLDGIPITTVRNDQSKRRNCDSATIATVSVTWHSAISRGG